MWAVCLIFFLLVFVICHTASVDALNWDTLEAKNLSKKKKEQRWEREGGGWGEREGWKEKCGNPDRWAVSCWTSLHLSHLFTPVLIKSTEMRIFPSCATYFPPRSPLPASLPCCTWVQVGWCQRPLISPPHCQLLMRVSQGGATTFASHYELLMRSIRERPWPRPAAISYCSLYLLHTDTQTVHIQTCRHILLHMHTYHLLTMKLYLSQIKSSCFLIYL